MHKHKKYIQLKEQLILSFQNYVDCNTLDDSIEYYNFLEEHSQEDALLFAIPMIERYIDELEDDLYDHLRCMVFHDGNNSMLHCLVKAEMKLTNADAKKYCNSLMGEIMAGLQKTAANGFSYDEQYLCALRKVVQNEVLFCADI